MQNVCQSCRSQNLQLNEYLENIYLQNRLRYSRGRASERYVPHPLPSLPKQPCVRATSNGRKSRRRVPTSHEAAERLAHLSLWNCTLRSKLRTQRRPGTYPVDRLHNWSRGLCTWPVGHNLLTVVFINFIYKLRKQLTKKTFR